MTTVTALLALSVLGPTQIATAATSSSTETHASKAADGKCGSAKCGADHAKKGHKSADAKCGADKKMADAKCGSK